MVNSKVNLYNYGTNYALEYKTFGDNILKNCEETLHKAGIFTTKKQSNSPLAQNPIKGISVEKTPDNIDEITDNKKTNDKANTQYNNEKTNTISSTKNIASDSYTKLAKKEQSLSTKTKLSPVEGSALRDINEAVNTYEDIENIGHKHLEQLTEELPEHGNLSGGTILSAEKEGSTRTQEYQLSIKNTWQSKSKKFGVVFNGQIGSKYTQAKAKSEAAIDDIDIDIDDDDNGDTDSNIKPNVDDSKGSNISEQQQNDADKLQSFKLKEYTGNAELHARYDTGRILIGGGVNYNRYNNGTQIANVYGSAVEKRSGIGGDITRRMTIIVDPETGERTLKSEMKVKIDIINNKANYYDDDEKSNLSEESATENNNDEINNIKDSDSEDDSYRTDTKGIKINSDGKSLNDDVNTENQKLREFNKRKDGTGIDLDFEYDQNKCGILGKYGFNITDNKEKNSLIQVSPILGVYDFTSPVEEEEDDEAVRITTGGLIEVNKEYANGSKFEGSGSIIYTRNMETGHQPTNTIYALLNLGYDNPKKKFYIGIDAAHIKSNSNIKISYLNTNVNKDFKNINLRLNAGISNITTYDDSSTDYQVSAHVTYTIPYGGKKK